MQMLLIYDKYKKILYQIKTDIVNFTLQSYRILMTKSSVLVLNVNKKHKMMMVSDL